MNIFNPFRGVEKVAYINPSSQLEIGFLSHSTSYYAVRSRGEANNEVVIAPLSRTTEFARYKGIADRKGKVYKHLFELQGFDTEFARKYIKKLEIDELIDETTVKWALETIHPQILLEAKVTFSTSEGEIISRPDIQEVTMIDPMHFDVVPENAGVAGMLLERFEEEYPNQISEFAREFIV